eukprot:1825744-Amphidinium_carterae.1
MSLNDHVLLRCLFNLIASLPILREMRVVAGRAFCEGQAIIGSQGIAWSLIGMGSTTPFTIKALSYALGPNADVSAVAP